MNKPLETFHFSQVEALVQALNQGHTVNDSLVTSRNIRYAAPPIGPLGFLAPTAPSINRTHIQNANKVVCPQAIPFCYTTGAATPFTASDIPSVDPRTSEDCLFLSVLLPKSVWNTRYEARFDLGWKNASNEGYGLVTQSQQFSGKEVIFWVQNKIHRLGGDRSQVTLPGESAGPFYAPRYPLPGFLVDAVLSFANVFSLATLRSMSSLALQKLNALNVGNSIPYGTWTFGVVVDDPYLPDTLKALFQQGRFDHSLSVITGHNQDDGSLFVPNKLLTNDSPYTAYIDSLFRPVTRRNNLTLADVAASLNSAPYAYEFPVSPAVHGADLPYNFDDSDSSNNAPGLLVFPRASSGMTVQDSEDSSLPVFPTASPGMTVQNMGVGPMLDEGGVQQLGKRCQFWQDTPFPGEDPSARQYELTWRSG
ncbi:Alpha/Beta hydrolase protein [Usnea florida]